jgi:hypothetical protein
MRVDRHGNPMRATEVNLQRVGATWEDPNIIFHSESFFQDGTPYRFAGAEPDRSTISLLVANGIIDIEESEELKRILVKIYEGLV